MFGHLLRIVELIAVQMFYPVKTIRSHHAKRYGIELEIGFRGTHFSITGKFLNKKRSRPGYSSQRSLFGLEKVDHILFHHYPQAKYSLRYLI